MGTVANLMVSPASFWISATGVALPDETTVAAGASWGASWTDLGFTSSPLAVGISREKFDMEVEQIANIVKQIITKDMVDLEVTLAEITAANLKYAMGASGSVATVAAGASQHGFETLAFGGDVLLPEYQVGFEAVNLDASGNKLVTRLFLYRVTLTMGGKMEFSKKAAAGIPLKITALADTTKSAGAQIGEFQRVTAWKTS